MNYRKTSRKNETPASPDRGRTIPRPYQAPETDPWAVAKQRYVQPILDTMDTLKGTYDNILNTFGVPVAKPRRK